MEAMDYGCSDNNGITSTLSANATSLSSFGEVNCGLIRKTPLQLQTLENLYSEDKYPTQSRMEDYAFALGLTFQQVRGWFVDRRRKDKSDGIQTKVTKKKSQTNNSCRKKKKKKRAEEELEKEVDSSDSDDDRYGSRRRLICIQDTLYSPEYILQKVFSKDGPPLGAEFDHVPSAAFQRRRCGSFDMENYGAFYSDEQIMLNTGKMHKASTWSCQHGDSVKRHGMGKGLMTAWHVLKIQHDCQQGKRRKVLSSDNGFPTKRHGIGKGLMNVWQAMHPDGGNYLGSSQFTNSGKKKSVTSNKKGRRQKPVLNQRRVGNKLQDKTKPAVRRRKVGYLKNESLIKTRRKECKLALEVVRSVDQHISSVALVDDEELELRELQSGPNPLTCTTHFSTGARHGCPLCKGLLPKFPPNSVRMKHLLCKHPWDSSLELVKKFFKVFHFLYTYAVIVDVCPFTMDEFVQAFHDKDSLLLGELHVCLLKLLLLDIEKELDSSAFPSTSKNCMFVSLLHLVQSRKFIANFWKKCLNPLTWAEILRQVLVAAGYGSCDFIQKKEIIDKEVNPMMKYGLSPGTLKGELFSILLERGNRGATVFELTEYSQIESLNLTNTKGELEGLICSVLAGDITLFEKISKSAYRLRSNNLMNGDENNQSETDSGSLDYSPKECGVSGCNDDFDCDSGNSNSRRVKNTSHDECETRMSSPGTEIDESHPGEAWVLGLMEGEYSDLSIEEKLNILVALVDLLSAGSSIRLEDPETAIAECVPKIYQHSSGAKIKRSSATQNSLFSTVQSEVVGLVQVHSAEVQPFDSASVLHGKDKGSGNNLHPMQSIFLGSDRRYNRYWLFLGPCIAGEPGHRRVYFESSEDGHWEIIETEEALCALVSALDSHGGREAILLAALEKRAPFLFEEMSNREADDSSSRQPTQSDQSELDRVNGESSSLVSDVDNYSGLFGASPIVLASSNALVQGAEKNVEGKTLKWKHLQAYDLWIWNLFYSNLRSVKFRKCSYFETLTRCETCHDLYWRDEKHCKCCHKTFELDFDLEEKCAIHVATCHVKDDADTYPMHKILPSQLQALKAAILAIELAMPENALIGAWVKSAHKLWVKRLRRTSSLPQMLQVLADLLGAVNKDWLSQCNVALDCDTTLEELIACFPNIPQTSSALALWLLKLDSLIASQVAEEPAVATSTGKRARDHEQKSVP